MHSKNFNEILTELDEVELSRILTVTKAELIQRITEIRDRRGVEPIKREDFKVLVRPHGSRRISSKMISFGMMERYFESEVRGLIESVRKNNPGKILIMEFWSFPYEVGGKKMRPDVLFRPSESYSEKNGQKPISTPKATLIAGREVKEVIEKTARRTAITAKPELAIISEADQAAAVTAKLASIEILAGILRETTVAEETVHIDTPEKPVVFEPPISPTTLDISALGEPSPGFLDKPIEFPEGTEEEPIETPRRPVDPLDNPINYDHRDWKLYRTSPVPRKVKYILQANGVGTPRKLLEVLGTNCPSQLDWDKFIERINEKVERKHRLGETSSLDFRDWMRRKNLIQPQFRKP